MTPLRFVASFISVVDPALLFTSTSLEAICAIGDLAEAETCEASTVLLQQRQHNFGRKQPLKDRRSKLLAELASLDVELARTEGNLSSSCVDTSASCGDWAKQGYCEQNAWMKQHCQKSCNICSGGTGTPCVDTDGRCSEWASGGECQNNPAWMSKSCRKSCSMCGGPTGPGSGQGDIDAFTFCGDGFRAQAHHWGFMHGFLSARPSQDVRVEWRDKVLGSNSGGGWFVGSVLHDPDVQRSLIKNTIGSLAQSVRIKYESYIRNVYHNSVVSNTPHAGTGTDLIGEPLFSSKDYLIQNFLSKYNGWKQLLLAAYGRMEQGHLDFNVWWTTTNAIVAQPESYEHGNIGILPKFYGGGKRDCHSTYSSGCDSDFFGCRSTSGECSHCDNDWGQCKLKSATPYQYLPSYIGNKYHANIKPERRVYIPLIDKDGLLEVAVNSHHDRNPRSERIGINKIHSSILTSTNVPSLYGGPSSTFTGIFDIDACGFGQSMSGQIMKGLFPDHPAWKTDNLAPLDVGLSMVDGGILDDTGILAAIHTLQIKRDGPARPIIVAHMDNQHDKEYQALWTKGDHRNLDFGAACRPRISIFSGAPSSNAIARTRSNRVTVWLDDVTTMENADAGILAGHKYRIITFATGQACNDKLVAMLVGQNLKSAEEYSKCASAVSAEVNEAMQLESVKKVLAGG